jgi:hypothetical protein
MATAALTSETQFIHCTPLSCLGRCLREIRNFSVILASVADLVPLHRLLIGIPLPRQNRVARDTANRNEHSCSISSSYNLPVPFSTP